MKRTEKDWKRIAGALLDVAYLSPEDYVNEKMVAALKRYFASDEDDLKEEA